MSHFAVLCRHDAGHLLPIGSLARELALRGHQLTVLGNPKGAVLAQRLELPLVELSSEGVSGPSSPLLWTAFHLRNAGGVIAMRNGFCRIVKVLLERGPRRLAELGVDGLLIDQDFVGGGTLAELLDLPFVTVCASLPWHGEKWLPPPFTNWRYRCGRRAAVRNLLGDAMWHWYMGPVIRTLNRYRAALKLPLRARLEDEFSPLAQFCQLCPEIDFPRQQLPACFHYVGPLAARRPAGEDNFPWHRLDGRPLIFASLGTVSERCNLPAFRRILAACAGLDAQLVLALGQWAEQPTAVRAALGEIPDNVLVVDFAPQLQLLERAALLITHAGLNTAMEALSRGVPMVALPRGADQPGVASRLEYAQVGVQASFHRTRTAELRQIVQRVLADDCFRRRARELQQAMLAAGGARRAAEIAEQALLTRRPVLRAPAAVAAGCVCGNGPAVRIAE